MWMTKKMLILIQLCVKVIVLFIVMPHGSNTLDEILQHPKSKLVPAGAKVTFHCKLADHLDSYWVVNNLPGATPAHLSELENRGFHISRSSQDGIATLSLTVTASMKKNGTVMFCSSVETFRTHQAVLVVIEDPPISPNPSAENPNVTSILLKWSPPFLWPGYSINYYNVSVSNSGHITHSHIINSSFNDSLVSLTIPADDPNIQSCHMLEILLSAVSNDVENLMTFPVSGGYIPAPSDHDLCGLDISVLFRPDRMPIVNINIELSEMICDYQVITYTFIIDANSENESTLGPYQQRGSDTISKTFMSEFKKDRDYNLTVVMDTVAGSIVSDSHYFNTTLQYHKYFCNSQPGGDAYVYKIVIIISLSLIGLILLTFILFTFRVAMVRIRERHGMQITESARRIHSALVPNPIYEGPLYETLETRLNPCVASGANTSIEPNNSLNSSPSLRYVERPRHATTCTPQDHLSSHAPAVEDHYTSVPISEQFQVNGSRNSLKLARVPLDTEYSIMILPAASTACNHEA